MASPASSSPKLRPRDELLDWLDQFGAGRNCMRFRQLLSDFPLLTPMEEAQMLGEYVEAQRRVIAHLLAWGTPLKSLCDAVSRGESGSLGDDGVEDLTERTVVPAEHSSKAREKLESTLKKRRSVITPGHIPLVHEIVKSCAGKKASGPVVRAAAERIFDMFSFEVILRATVYVERAKVGAEQFEDYRLHSRACERLETALFNHNSRLVMSLARRRIGFMQSCYLDDLFQVGAVGLMDGIRKYRHGMNNGANTKLSTIATPWITHRIRRWMDDNCNNIRIPVHQKETVRLVKLAMESIAVETHSTQDSDVTNEEIAARIARMTEGKAGMTADDVANARAFCFKEISLDKPSGEDGQSGQMHEAIADPQSTQSGVNSVQDALAQRMAIREAIRSLTLAERVMVAFHYGIPESHERQSVILDWGKERKEQVKKRMMDARRKLDKAGHPTPPVIKVLR